MKKQKVFFSQARKLNGYFVDLDWNTTGTLNEPECPETSLDPERWHE